MTNAKSNECEFDTYFKGYFVGYIDGRNGDTTRVLLCFIFALSGFILGFFLGVLS